MMRNINSKTLPYGYKSTPETTNLARVARLILDPCTDLLRDILREKISPCYLSKIVKIWIDDLKKKKLKNPLNKQQIALIFPLPTKQYGGDYSDFDISLLYILLRSVCKIIPHNTGWGREPDPSDNSVSANIERIRLTRNKYYGHAADFSLSESDFITEWQNIYNITVEIEQHFGSSTVYQDAMKDIRTCSMDPEIEAKYIDKLLLIDELCETVKSHTDFPERQLIQWREEDEVYSETHTFPDMLNKVRTQLYMTFVGDPGSGKSATIHHIALILQGEGYEVLPIIDISEIYRYCDSHNPQVFVIDDVVGVFGLQKQKLETLVDYEKIISDPSKRTKVLMSCREAVFNECYKSFFINEENVIKMCSPENSLNDDDKKAILQTHDLDKDLLSPTLLRETSTMFPLLCKLISKEANFRNNIERFFTCPTECILKEFDKMQEQNRLHYATLVLCLLNDNKLSKEILQNTENKAFYEMKSKALESCEVESYTDPFKFVKVLAAMEGTYTKLYGTEYTFIHDSMFEIIAHHFGSQFLDLILQFMNSSYIANYVKLQKDEMLKLENEPKQASEKVAVNSGGKKEINTACESSQKGEKVVLSAENSDKMESFDLCIRIGEDQYSMLAERLYKDIENMELYDVFMNDILKHPSVCQAFIEVLKAKSYSELKSLFLSEQKDVSKVVSKGKLVREESEKREERNRERRRQEVLVNYGSDCLKTKYSVRVISWVVYYGHNKILQYILEQTESHKETQSELFLNSFNLALLYTRNPGEKNIAANCPIENLWSFRDWDIDGSISEHQRLLLLSCYNGDLETVRMFIKYLKRNTIYMTFPDLDFKYVLGNETLEAACEGGHLRVVKELLEAGADVNPKDDYYTPLTAACKNGHVSIIKELIKAGAKVNPQGFYDTPLIAACEDGYISIVKELLGAGADVNLQNRDATPLIATSNGGHLNIVRELLQAGADVNQPGKWKTPLIAAFEGGHLDVVRELLEAGADVNLQGGFNTPLTAACKDGHLNIVRELLEAGVSLQNEFHTPLIGACEGGHLNVVKELLEKGADVNLQGKVETPLITACKNGHLNLVRELILAGADVNLQGKLDTPLKVACKGGHLNVVRELLLAGADVNLQGKLDNLTPLIAACEGGNLNMVRELLAAGADVNLEGYFQTPLKGACQGGHLNIVKELLMSGADVNLQDEYYYHTKLIVECDRVHESFVKKLLRAGADVDLQSIHETPLTAACYGGHLSIVMELLKAGADVNRQIKSYTPLTAACWGGHKDIVEELVKAGADANIQSVYETPLLAACYKGHLSIVIKLLKTGADVNIKIESYTALTVACSHGHDDIVEELVKAGADVNLRGKNCKACDLTFTPLTLACEGGYMNVVKTLLKAGADVNPQDEFLTPVTAAIEGGYMRIMKELLSAGADVNLHGKYETPLTVACYDGHLSIVMELLKAGADVNLQGNDDTPMTVACNSGYTSIVIGLLKAGADVNLQGQCDTPLTATCKNGYMNIAKKLLDAGSDVNMQDKAGNTPLYIAFFNIHKNFIPAIIRMFDGYGVDSTIKNNESMSAFFIALIRNEIGSVKQLLRTENERHLKRMKLHLFDCLVNIRHSDVMTDSKDDVVVTRRRVWRMEDWEDLYYAVVKSDCKALKHLVCVGLDVNQWIQLYTDYDEYDVKPLLFTQIDRGYYDDGWVDNVRILLESGVDVSVRVRYEEYDSVLDREGVSVLERIRRQVNKDKWDREEVFNYTRVIKEVKKHVRRYSV